MDKNMSKGMLILFLAALLLLNLAVVADLAVIVAAGGIFETFGDQPNLVNYILSGPALISAFVALACGLLMRYFSKKTLLIASFGLFAVGGILGVAVENALYVAAMRTLVGAGYGIVMVVAIALIAEVLTDEKRRSTVMGINNAASTAIGTVVSLIAGVLATTSWKAVFNLYWAAVPILVLAIFFIPKTPAEGRQQTGGPSGASERIPLGSFGRMLVSALALTLAWAIVYYQIALYVVENTLGDAALAGVYASLATVGSAVACLLFGAVYPRLKTGSILVSYAVMAAVLFALYFTRNAAIAGVAWTLGGAAFGFGFTYFFMHTTVVVPPTRISYSIGFVSAGTGFAFFASTFLATFFKGLLRVDTITGVIPAALAILAIGGVLSIVSTVKESRPVAVGLAEPAAE